MRSVLVDCISASRSSGLRLARAVMSLMLASIGDRTLLAAGLADRVGRDRPDVFLVVGPPRHVHHLAQRREVVVDLGALHR
jgi:hypothetical protein